MAGPGAFGCHFQVSCACWGLEKMSCAFWRCQPRRNWFSLGLSAHLTRMARRSGRRLNLNHNSLIACVHGVMDVHSVVVRTTETMAIHSSSLCRGERHEMMTKRMNRVRRRCASLVLGQLQRPVAERQRGVGLQSHNVACGRGDGTAGLDMSRIRTGVFHRQRRRT